MVERRTGLTKDSPKNFLVDAPTILINGVSVGACQDGATFMIEQTIRTPNIDGARGPIMGTRRVVNSIARLTFQPKEWTPTNWRNFIAGAQGSPVKRSVYVIGSEFHLSEVAIAGTRQDGKEIVISIYNALGDPEEIEAAMEDESEAAPEIRLTAHFDPTNTSGAEPWQIKFPS